MSNKPTNSFEQVQKKFSAAFEAMGDYTINQRDTAVKETRKALAELDAEVDRLDHRVRENWKTMEDDSQQAASEALRRLKDQRNELGEKLGALQQGGEQAWDEMTNGFQQAWKGFKTAWRQADEKSRPED